MITSNSEGQEFVHVMSEVGVTKSLEQFSNHESEMDGKFTLLNSGRLGPGTVAVMRIQHIFILREMIHHDNSFFLT